LGYNSVVWGKPVVAFCLVVVGQDAADLGVDTIEQADISVARDGSIILVVTPIILASDPSQQGCMVFSFDDFATASPCIFR
jgi:hypothetical protein